MGERLAVVEAAAALRLVEAEEAASARLLEAQAAAAARLQVRPLCAPFLLRRGQQTAVAPATSTCSQVDAVFCHGGGGGGAQEVQSASAARLAEAQQSAAARLAEAQAQRQAAVEELQANRALADQYSLELARVKSEMDKLQVRTGCTICLPEL